MRPESPTRRTRRRILRATAHPGQPPYSFRQPNGKHPFSGCFPLFFTMRPVPTAHGRKQEAGGRRQEAGSKRQKAEDGKRRATTDRARENRPADRNNRRLPQPAAASLRNRHPALAPHRRPAGSGRSATARPQKARETRRARQNAPPGKAEHPAAQGRTPRPAKPDNPTQDHTAAGQGRTRCRAKQNNPTQGHTAAVQSRTLRHAKPINPPRKAALAAQKSRGRLCIPGPTVTQDRRYLRLARC